MKHAHDCPEADRLVDEAIRGIGAEIDALRVPRLAGVVLGGGYGRGEGGVFLPDAPAPGPAGARETGPEPAETPPAEGRAAPFRLSNDLDFYVVAEEGAAGAELARIGEALRPVSEKWTARLGVDVDFSPAKTPWRLAHDQDRLMIQELVHGFCDVAGKPGAELFAHVERRDPSAFPLLEAVRLLVNRGAGLLLAAGAGASGDFAARNVNKCVLGCGDARLVARGGYRWRVEDRAAALGDPLYAAAVQWKFRPRREPVCGWETARAAWLDAVAALPPARAGGRSLRAAARWLARRRSPGPAPLRTLGLDPLVRILRAMLPLVRDRRPFPPSLRRDWEVFN